MKRIVDIYSSYSSVAQHPVLPSQEFLENIFRKQCMEIEIFLQDAKTRTTHGVLPHSLSS